MAQTLGTLWVCTDCMLSHANGETPEAPECEPLGLIPAGHSVTAGLLEEEHSEDCTAEARDSGECTCDRDTFSSSRCEGCGSTLGGERHALTLWKD